jgi:UDP-N-acetylmuramate--alanine ligase
VFVSDKEQVADVLKDILQPGDLLLTQGAGDITALAHELNQVSLVSED